MENETVNNNEGRKQLLKSYEGYLQKGQIYPLRPLINTHERVRVIITVLDEPLMGDIQHKPALWLDEFNRLLNDSGDEKLSMENFPRADFTREHIEVKH